jgi:hypothetical protein
LQHCHTRQRFQSNSPTQSSCRLGSLELGRKAFFHNPHILPTSRHLSQLVVRPPVTRSPTRPANKLIGIVVQHIQDIADDFNAVLSVTSTQLANESLALVRLQILSERSETVRQSVVAESVLATFLVEVLMQFENEVIRAAVRVLNAQQRRRAIREAHGVRPVGRREEDHLGGCTCAADGGHHGLRGRGPFVHVEVGGAVAVVRLVHDAEYDARVGGPVRGDLGPGCGESVGGRPVLAYDAAGPAAVVVNVDAVVVLESCYGEAGVLSLVGVTRREGKWEVFVHAMRFRARVQTDLHQLVILLKVCSIQFVGLDVLIDQLLPRHRQAEDVEAVDVGEVLHLGLCHVCGWTAVLAFELVGSPVAL